MRVDIRAKTASTQYNFQKSLEIVLGLIECCRQGK